MGANPQEQVSGYKMDVAVGKGFQPILGLVWHGEDHSPHLKWRLLFDWGCFFNKCLEGSLDLNPYTFLSATLFGTFSFRITGFEGGKFTAYGPTTLGYPKIATSLHSGVLYCYPTPFLFHLSLEQTVCVGL